MHAQKKSLNDLRILGSENVYAPREDSFLLAHALENERNAERALDLGTGSGVIGLQLALNGAKNITVADVAGEALILAQKNFRRNGFRRKISFVESDLFDKIQGTFDLIAFNPPYVPSNGIKWLDTDGGRKGREVLDTFLHDFPRHLKATGHCYFIQSSLNGMEKTKKILRTQGFACEIIAREKAAFEELFVLKGLLKTKT